MKKWVVPEHSNKAVQRASRVHDGLAQRLHDRSPLVKVEPGRTS